MKLETFQEEYTRLLEVVREAERNLRTKTSELDKLLADNLGLDVRREAGPMDLVNVFLNIVKMKEEK